MKICPPHSTTVELQFIYLLIFYKNKQINDELERERERERERSAELSFVKKLGPVAAPGPGL
jgi:hypothetical protein